MLQNAPTLAIVAVHTAENGPSKVHQVMNKIIRNIGETRPIGADSRGYNGRGPELLLACAQREDQHRRKKTTTPV